ncbi:hypothetical protein DXN04_24645 [Chitinophaga silvisoli]|uniref:Uncharacterized protein n=1 Tax=Chitinophaga silvisoli TaxID=2291814 RepID=A0A3E1NVN0_9BACT|nr:hypothetical protein DXN04_24645 [Chitinophaga silvisoli]
MLAISAIELDIISDNQPAKVKHLYYLLCKKLQFAGIQGVKVELPEERFGNLFIQNDYRASRESL